MRIGFDPTAGELDVSGTANELTALADVVRAGEGGLPADAASRERSAYSEALRTVKVRTTEPPDSLVVICVDVAALTLLIRGGLEKLAVLANSLAEVARWERSGHVHIEYHPGHYYLDPNSAAVVVNSPHGSMP
ncbi:MAG TPA: hypothetical protein VFS43_09410 [Polyangiaceae bacterium]|nr:hypothetical protein [Polyangiaceae bacterium]